MTDDELGIVAPTRSNRPICACRLVTFIAVMRLFALRLRALLTRLVWQVDWRSLKISTRAQRKSKGKRGGAFYAMLSRSMMVRQPNLAPLAGSKRFSAICQWSVSPGMPAGPTFPMPWPLRGSFTAVIAQTSSRRGALALAVAASERSHLSRRHASAVTLALVSHAGPGNDSDWRCPMASKR